jgi:hypothetical protein
MNVEEYLGYLQIAADNEPVVHGGIVAQVSDSIYL